MEIKGIKIDTFTKAYLACAIWAGGEDGNLDEFSIHDFTESALRDAARDCARFQEANAGPLEAASNEHDYEDEQAGHDFFLTRNHHGAGFWDRGIGEYGAAMTKSAHDFGEAYISEHGGALNHD